MPTTRRVLRVLLRALERDAVRAKNDRGTMGMELAELMSFDVAMPVTEVAVPTRPWGAAATSLVGGAILIKAGASSVGSRSHLRSTSRKSA